MESFMDKRHVLDLDTYSKKDIESLLENTVEMKKLLQLDTNKIPSLNGKTVVNIFLEASTRTRVSFERAAKILSADVINVSGSGSSIEKGESLYNTALTLQAMNADIIIVRHLVIDVNLFINLNHTANAYYQTKHGDHL